MVCAQNDTRPLFAEAIVLCLQAVNVSVDYPKIRVPTNQHKSVSSGNQCPSQGKRYL